GWLELIPYWIVVLVIGRDLIIVGGALVYTRLVGRPEMAPTRISKFNTTAQITFMISILMALAGVALPAWWIWTWLAIVVVTTLWSGVDYVWRWGGRALSEFKEKE
ncbi:MAG TPA: CDP-alcohol phosphatidyltransferase family protein, partial [Gammaproteobacteria bacterium]